MKKITNVMVIVILAIAYATSVFAFSAKRAEVTERWVERRDGVIVEDHQKVTSMLIPKNEELSALRNELKGSIKGFRSDLFGNQKKGIEGAIPALKTSQDNLRDELVGANGVIPALKTSQDNLRDELVGENGALTKVGGTVEDIKIAINGDGKTPGMADNVAVLVAATGKGDAAIEKAAFILGVLFILGVAVIVVSRRLRVGRVVAELDPSIINGLSSAVEAIEKASADIAARNLGLVAKLAMIPEDTARLVKQLEPATITATVAGKKIIYIPKIVDGKYLSLRVLKQAGDASNPAEILRGFKGSAAKIHSDTVEIMAKFYNGDFNDLNDPYARKQTEVIRYEQAPEGGLRIA